MAAQSMKVTPQPPAPPRRVRVVRGVSIGGQSYSPGEHVEVDERLAIRLIHSAKVVPADVDAPTVPAKRAAKKRTPKK